MKRSALLALILVYAAMLAANWVSKVIFERLPHLEDEIAYIYQARIFEQGHLYLPTPEPRQPYWQPFVVNCTPQYEDQFDLDCDGRTFGKYPPGWPMLLAFGTLNKLPWVVNMWLAGLTVALVYRLGRELYDETAGVVAALLLTISPIAVLLNGSLMGHTSALFFVMLFAYSLWRIEQKRRVWWWGMLAGISLGMLIVTRPISAVGIAIPFVLYSGLRLAWLGVRRVIPADKFPTDLLEQYFSNVVIALTLIFTALAIFKAAWFWAILRILLIVLLTMPTLFLIGWLVGFFVVVAMVYQREFWRMVTPLIVLTVFTLLVGALYPAFNYALTGNPRANLYQLVWEYDTFGFGEEHGRSGHTPQEGWVTTKVDVACYTRDLFGWVEQPDDPPTVIEGGNECLRDQRGLGYVLLIPALLLVTRRRWSVLLLAVAGSLITLHIGYWIGAGVYSARYYFEGTGALVLVSAAGVSGLAQLADKVRLRSAVYALLGIAVTISVIGYTPQRLEALKGYGCITQQQYQQVEALRDSKDIPVLVIAYGDQNACKGRPSWRDMGSLMGITDPYTEYDVIMLRDLEKRFYPILLQKYPDHQIMYMMYNQVYRSDENRQPPDIAQPSG